MYVAPCLSKFSLVRFFISIPKSELRRELLLTKPTMLLDAIELTRMHESKIQELKKDQNKSWVQNSYANTTIIGKIIAI